MRWQRNYPISTLSPTKKTREDGLTAGLAAEYTSVAPLIVARSCTSEPLLYETNASQWLVEKRKADSPIGADMIAQRLLTPGVVCTLVLHVVDLIDVRASIALVAFGMSLYVNAMRLGQSIVDGDGEMEKGTIVRLMVLTRSEGRGSG